MLPSSLNATSISDCGDDVTKLLLSGEQSIPVYTQYINYSRLRPTREEGGWTCVPYCINYFYLFSFWLKWWALRRGKKVRDKTLSDWFRNGTTGEYYGVCVCVNATAHYYTVSLIVVVDTRQECRWGGMA